MRTWANSEMPTVATSPSTLTHSCDFAYLRSSITADAAEAKLTGHVLGFAGVQ